jgi:hypothetical protein
LKIINYTLPLENSSRPKLTQDSAVWVSVSGVCDEEEEHEMSGNWIFLLLRERRRIELKWWRGMHGLVVVILQFDFEKHRNCCAATMAIATMFHIFVLLMFLLFFLLSKHVIILTIRLLPYSNCANGRSGF